MPDERPWSEKSEIEKAITVGLSGPPDLRRKERSRLLGELQERVLATLRASDLKRRPIDRKVERAIKDPRAAALIIDGDLPYEDLSPYIKLARESGLNYTMRSDPSHAGDVALVVVSDQALS